MNDITFTSACFIPQEVNWQCVVAAWDQTQPGTKLAALETDYHHNRHTLETSNMARLC